MDIKDNRPILTVNLKQIQKNWLTYRQYAPQSEISAVIKANAYGIGALNIAQTLTEIGCKLFWVATVHEAIYLRENGITADIAVFEGFTKATLPLFYHHNITAVINTTEQLTLWNKYPHHITIWIHFDTGMTRLGIPDCDVHNAIHSITALTEKKHLIAGYMSHYLESEIEESDRNIEQWNRLQTIINVLPPAPISMANSYGAVLDAVPTGDVVRIGIGLYGFVDKTIDSNNGKSFSLESALHLQAPILQTQSPDAGTTIGYNAQYTVPETPHHCATVGIGYADGISIALSNKGAVTKNGHQYPVVGRISMDTLCIGFTDFSVLKTSEYVTLFKTKQDIENICKIANIPAQSVLTGLSARIRKNYINE